MRTATLIQTTYDTTLSSINFGLTLATALAWNEYFKFVVNEFLAKGKGGKYLLMYALSMTILATLFLIISRKLADKKIVKDT